MFYTEFRENIKEDIYMERRVMIAAHRGTSGANIIQNTIGAYENALLHGADILELDVIQTVDGDFFTSTTARSRGLWARIRISAP